MKKQTEQPDANEDLPREAEETAGEQEELEHVSEDVTQGERGDLPEGPSPEGGGAPDVGGEEASDEPEASGEPSPMVWVNEESKQAWRDRGLVVLVAALVYLPLLGSFGAWDPWETHYGEVGRQILERHDWISSWWGSHWTDAGGDKEGRFFYSKPILLMWMMAMGMQIFGFNEFAIRIGVCSLAILVLVLVYSMGREVFSRRAGFLMTGVLGTSPFFYMLGRQAQTDMPFVGLMTIGLCFFMMGVFGRNREERPDRLSYALTLGWTGLVCVPQISLVLVGLSRWRGPRGSWLAGFSKSPGVGPTIGGILLGVSAAVLLLGVWAHKSGKAEGIAQKLRRLTLGRWALASALVLWVPLLGFLGAAMVGAASKPGLVLNGWFVWGPVQAAIYQSCLMFAFFWAIARPDITRRQVYLFGFYVFTGLATLAKGLLGFMLPGAVLFFYILLTREWRMLKRVELVRGIPIFIAVSFPWYAGMLIRHTRGFWNRFFIHDHFKRLASGVHQVDEGSFEHFARWLAYGLFPWSAFVPAAIARLFTAPGGMKVRDDRSRAILMIALWVLVSFTLFTLSSTKFHHYIFPVVPALAMLVGLVLDDALDRELPSPWPLFLLGLGIVAVVGWDIGSDNQIPKNLFTYKYDRRWDHLGWDAIYRWAVVGLTLPSLIGMGLMLMRNTMVRRVGLGLIFVATIGFSYFTLDWYMPRLSETWSQKGMWDAYYAQCDEVDGPPGAHPYKKFCAQPVIAYKLNWRGENFYSQGEAIPIRDDDDFEHFLSQQKDEPFYGVMEMARWRGEFQRNLPAKLKRSTCVTFSSRMLKFALVKIPCAPDDPDRLDVNELREKFDAERGKGKKQR